jgi:hypothetical protein
MAAPATVGVVRHTDGAQGRAVCRPSARTSARLGFNQRLRPIRPSIHDGERRLMCEWSWNSSGVQVVGDAVIGRKLSPGSRTDHRNQVDRVPVNGRAWRSRI